MSYINRLICYEDSADSSLGASLGQAATATAQATTQGVELAFNEAGMREANAYINSAYQTLLQSFKEIDDMFNEYIPGIAINTPVFAPHLNSVWQNYSDTKFSDFVSHFEEWSGVLTTVYEAGVEHTEEAMATFTADGKFIEKEGVGSEEMKRILSELSPLVTYEGNKKVQEMTNLNTDYRDSNELAKYTSAKSGMSEEELAALEIKNKEQVDRSYYLFKGLMKDIEEVGVDKAKDNAAYSLVLRTNPDVWEMYEARYKEETGKNAVSVR